MTNEELITKIKAEIERRMDKHWEGLPNADAPEDDWTHNELCELGAYKELEHLETFLSDLDSEKPMQNGLDVTDFCKPIDPGIAQCITDHSWEMLGEDEKPVPNDLKEAAQQYAEGPECTWVGTTALEYAFIAGAKWQADHTPLPEDTALFNKGVEEGKRLMMEEAVEWLVDDDYNELTDKGRFILGSVGIGYNGYYIPYSDLLKLPKEDEK